MFRVSSVAELAIEFRQCLLLSLNNLNQVDYSMSSTKNHDVTEDFVQCALNFWILFICVHVGEELDVRLVPYSSDYKIHFSPQIWEENGGASYSLKVAYLACWWGGSGGAGS